jgi:FkbM family methyltransferase
MHLAFDPLRFCRQAIRILRVREPRPSVASLLKCWLAIKFARKEDPLTVRLGSLLLSGPNQRELHYLFEEVFVREEYLVRLATNSAPVIVDCGANIGFAMLYFKLHYPGAHITSFEPNPSCFEHLQRHIVENQLRDVTAVQAACGLSNGEISFFCSPGFSPASSIHASRANGEQEIKVKLVKLSDYITGPVDLFKLDVEGAESGILQDLVSTGKIVNIQRMIIEYHHRIGGAKPELSHFLESIEDAGFTYDIAANINSRARFSDSFQDVMIYAIRRGVRNMA